MIHDLIKLINTEGVDDTTQNLFINYDSYLKEKNALDPTNAAYVYNSIVNSPLNTDTEYKDLWENVIEAAIKYSHYRANWYSWDIKKRKNEDEYRSSKHNALISRINILARFVKEKEGECNWRDVLGDDRKRIGDFACYITLVRSLNAR